MDEFEFNVDEKLRPSVERALTGTTKLDTQIAALPTPERGIATKLAVLLLRQYRKVTPASIRQRCVFEPSCSHYSEMAIRQHGIIRGLSLTTSRLRRCKNGNGGLDLTNLNMDAKNEI